MKKPMFQKCSQVTVQRAGFPNHPIGTIVTIASVVNTATKRNPEFRYYGNGLWFYESDVLAA